MPLENASAAEPAPSSQKPDPGLGGEAGRRRDEATDRSTSPAGGPGSASSPNVGDQDGHRIEDAAGALDADQAGKGPIIITRAGEPGSGADTRSSAAATRTT